MHTLKHDADGWIRLYDEHGNRIYDIAFLNFEEKYVTDPPLGELYSIVKKMVDGGNFLLTTI